MPGKRARKTRARKARSSMEYAFVDAKKPFTLHITWEDIKGAVVGDGRDCVLSRAGRREHNCYDILVHRNVAYVRKTERSVPVRYQVTEAAKDVLVAFDASGRAQPITVTFVPPRRALSTKYLRSPERKAREKASRERCKLRDQKLTQRIHSQPSGIGPVPKAKASRSSGAGPTAKASRTPRAGTSPLGRRRMYTKPNPLTLFGVRNGTGVRPLGRGKLRV